MRTTANTVPWPQFLPGFTLQQNTNGIARLNWSNASGHIQDNGTTKTLIVNPPSEKLFYRLVKP